MLSCNLPPALLAEWLGSFKCFCSNSNSKISQHRKLTVEKKILQPLLLGLKSVTFQPWVWCSTHWTIPAIWLLYLYLFGTFQHPGTWHKRNGGGLHSGLAALAGCSENSSTVHRVGVNCGVVEMVPVTAVCTKNEFCTALCDSAVC